METRESRDVFGPTPKIDRVAAGGVAVAGVLALLALALGAMLFFARQDLGAAEREAASLRSDLQAEREVVEELEGEVGDLEGSANAAQIEVAEIRAVAAKCVTEVLRATNASLEFRYGDALFWLRESRRTCRPIMEAETAGVL